MELPASSLSSSSPASEDEECPENTRHEAEPAGDRASTELLSHKTRCSEGPQDENTGPQGPDSDSGDVPTDHVQPVFLKEFAPLTHILNQIPQHAQRGLNKVDLKLTCLDVIAEYLAVGSNAGVVFLYDRTRNTVTRLKCSDVYDTVTCVSIVASVDFMVAAGCQSGRCVVYQIPMEGTRSKMEKYLIENIHRTSVTCICWSPNAMKIFSGDAGGLVSCTEIDYDQHLSTTKKIFSEEHPVVQVDYVPQLLLVSTMRRTVVCHLAKNNVVVQFGQRDRKSPGNFGACFAPQPFGERRVTVWACRPKMRLWRGTPEGVVLETLLLQDSLGRTPFTPQTLHLPKGSCLNKLPEAQFGPLKPYLDGLLLTWSNEAFFVIDPRARAFAVVCPGFVNITDVAVWGDEVFVLQARRHIVRLASHPEEICWSLSEESDNLLPDMATIKNTLATPLAEIGALIKEHRVTIPDTPMLQLFKGKANGSVLDWIRQKAPHGRSQNESINGTKLRERADSAEASSVGGKSGSAVLGTGMRNSSSANALTALPPRETTAPTFGRVSSFQTLLFLDEPEAEESIVFNAKKTKSKKSGTSNNLTVPKQRPPSPKNQRPSPVPTYDEVFSSHHATGGLVPQGSSPLNPSPLNPSPKSSERPPPYDGPEDEMLSQILSRFGQLKRNELHGDTAPSPPQEDSSRSSSSTPPPAEVATELEVQSLSSSLSGDADPSPEDDDLEQSAIEDIYGKPEDDNANFTEPAPSPVPDVCFHGIAEPRFPHYDLHWAQVKGPGSVMCLAVCDGYLCCVDSRDNVFYSRHWGREFTWKKGSRPTNRLALSPSGGTLWTLYKERLYAARSPMKDEPLSLAWDEVIGGVASVGVTETTAWYVSTSGEVFMCPNTATNGRPPAFRMVSCFVKVQQVTCYDDIVWVLTAEDHLLAREGISDRTPWGISWVDVTLPSKASPACISLGYNCTGWLIDSDGNVFFKTNLKNSSPRGYNNTWWQMDLNEFVYQFSPPLSKMHKNLSSVFSADKISHKVLGRGKWLLAAGKHGVWFCESTSTLIYTCRRDITGYFWEKAHVNWLPQGSKWLELAAQGVFKDQGVVWGRQSGGRLAAISPVLRKWWHVTLPKTKGGEDVTVTCVAPSPESLWVLTSAGEILVRTGQDPNCPLGKSWAILDLAQLGGTQLVHLSCSNDTVWACDSKGVVYMRLGSLRPPAERTLPPAWVPVESGYQEDSPFVSASASDKAFSLPFEISRFLRPHLTKVYVGPQNFMVWAIDNKKRVYVREGIYPELHIGTSWVEVPGVQARQLCISEKAVWAVTPSGEIFRRFNISNTNFVGDYWKRIPGHVSTLAASIDDRLWAASLDGCALQLLTCTLPSRVEQVERLAFSTSTEKSDSDTDGWEVV
uniref:Putative proline-rich receptor-like protein kinase perk7 n=1 Tax=Ixodes ricinus TaxID=34613 RepID=A0A6B0VG60_IXORI